MYRSVKYAMRISFYAMRISFLIFNKQSENVSHLARKRKVKRVN